ncbi:hypothetical protein [Pradoshia sp. D12]|uniref:hypothetical protein n=1 Tax=Pradoshia sp. D12 TaxID=2651284 RepID=UPI00178C7681|nr:hypothetical protein [Pradoshia sp. D12]
MSIEQTEEAIDLLKNTLQESVEMSSFGSLVRMGVVLFECRKQFLHISLPLLLLFQ